jgi:hypothetical protein
VARCGGSGSAKAAPPDAVRAAKSLTQKALAVYARL